MCRAVTASVVNVLIIVRGVSLLTAQVPAVAYAFPSITPRHHSSKPGRSRTLEPCSEEASLTRTTRSSVRVARSRPCGRRRSDLFAAKTTDENLTGENWELILNLCDKVQEEGEQG